MAAVVEVIPIPPEGGGADVVSGGTYPLRFMVQMDGVYADHTQVISATDGVTAIPDYGATHPTDTTARVVDKRATPDEESPDWWTVVVTYKVPEIDPDPAESPDAPNGGSNASTTQSPIPNTKQSFKLFRRLVAADYDVTGTIEIKNSAGDPYDPPAQKELIEAEFTLTRTQSTFSVQWALDYANARNHEAFEFAGIKWERHELRVVDIEGEWPTGSVATGGVGHQVKIVIRADRVSNHELELLDAGFRSLVGGVPTAITEPNGTPVTQPRRLDGAGGILAHAAASVYNSYRMGPSVDFKKLFLSWNS